MHNHIIPHAYFTSAVSAITQGMRWVEAGAKPPHLLLVGPPGAGKTTLLEHIQQQHPATRTEEGRHVPVVLACIPPTPTIKGVCQEIAHVLGDPHYRRGTETEMKIRVVQLLKAARTKALMLDEFQHLVDRYRGKKKQTDVADWIKVLVEATGVLFVAAGLPRAQHVVSEGDQLPNRFREPVMLPRLDWRFKHTRAQFLLLIKAFARHYDEPALADEGLAFRLYCATGGLLRSLANLLAYANLLAKESQRKLATPSILAQAYSEILFQKSPVVEQPFDIRTDLTPTPDLLARIAQSMKISDDPYDSVDREPSPPMKGLGSQPTAPTRSSRQRKRA